PGAYFCENEPQRSLATAVHDCGRPRCAKECAHDALGPGPGTDADMFCDTAGPAFCDALFACCSDPLTLQTFGSILSVCKSKMSAPGCFLELNVDDWYYTGIRGWLEAGQTILAKAQLDTCVAKLKAMAAGGAACTEPPVDFFIRSCVTAFKGQIALGDAC